jgi:uncharacterized protein
VRSYLDSAPSIYFVERIPPWFDQVRIHLATPGLIPVASDLTRMECRILPLRRGDQILLNEFDRFFDQVMTERVSLTSDVMDVAAEIRARFRFKTPDAIHLAAATVSGCDVFLTNDHRLDGFTDIRVEVLQP